MVRIELKNINYVRSGITILKDINLVIEEKEYCIFVGPTGAGKTSLIGLISGLYRPTSGKIFFDGKDVTKIPPNERHCGVMFESYALFPHLKILDNVGFAQYLNTLDTEQTMSIAEELLAMVRIKNRNGALPKECSGGMQQRIALARALMALESSGLLILDEPFKALDAGLRMNLRKEVRDIAKSPQLGLTTIHITNDMQEAMLGDKIVVLDHGQIRQIGTPKEIMYSPVDLFVANFFSTELNYFEGNVLAIEDVPEPGFKLLPLKKVIIQSKEGYFLYAKTERIFEIGQEVTFIIRAQYFKARHKRREDKTNNIVGKVKRVKFMGAWLRLEIEAPYRLEYFLCKSGDESSQPPATVSLPEKQGSCETDAIKLLKIEVPTTKVATHNFIVGETVTVYYPSEYVIVFPRIPQEMLDSILRVA
jgi:ABC-type Fe3+/spermidine/putrescine transport system ATPase subunit